MGSLLSSMLKAIRRIFSWKICFFLEKNERKIQTPLSIATDAVAVTPLWNQGQSVSQSRSRQQQDCSRDHHHHPPVPSHPFPETRTHPPPRCSQLWRARQPHLRLQTYGHRGLPGKYAHCGLPGYQCKSFQTKLSAETLTIEEQLQSSWS